MHAGIVYWMVERDKKSCKSSASCVTIYVGGHLYLHHGPCQIHGHRPHRHMRQQAAQEHIIKAPVQLLLFQCSKFTQAFSFSLSVFKSMIQAGNSLGDLAECPHRPLPLTKRCHCLEKIYFQCSAYLLTFCHRVPI